jgi:hypothetical protein
MLNAILNFNLYLIDLFDSGFIEMDTLANRHN